MVHFTYSTEAWLQVNSGANIMSTEGRTATGQFAPGVSGNPAGKPKGAVSLYAILNEALKGDYYDKKTKKKTPYAVLLVKRMMDKAISEGNDKMIQEIWNRIEGKSVQPINLGGQAGNPLQFMEVDADTQAKIVAMQARWFTEDKKARTKVSTKPQPSDNQMATKVKVKVKAKVKRKK